MKDNTGMFNKRLHIIFALFLLALITFFELPRYNKTYAWVLDDYIPCSKKSIKQNEVCAAGAQIHVVDNLQKFTIQQILGAVEGVTVAMGEYKNDPQYVRQLNSTSALASVNNLIFAIYTNPPANTYAFIKDAGISLGFIPKSVNAQGVGFSGLTPLLSIWKSFRNISYLLLALFMIVIGLMVMFRKKIDPKTVVTVQNALPKIIITLILITFSYAIVGIMIDLMYLLIFLIVAIIGSSTNMPVADIAKLQADYTTGGWTTLIASIFGTGAITAVDDLVRFLWPFGFSGLGTGAAVGTTLSLPTIIAFLLSQATNPVGWIGIAVGVGVPALAYILLAVILLFAFFRVLFMLGIAYIQIIVSLIFAPLQLLLEAIPGGDGFTSWIANLISNLLVFPVTVGLLLLGSTLSTMEPVLGGKPLWAPPLLAGGSSGIQGFIALGIILSIPSIVKGIQETLKAKPPLPVTAGIGAAISSPVGTGMQAISSLYYIKQLGGDKIWSRLAGKPPTEPHTK